MAKRNREERNSKQGQSNNNVAHNATGGDVVRNSHDASDHSQSHNNTNKGIKLEESNINAAVDNVRNRAIHIEAGRGNIEEIASLIDKGADINAKNNHGLTPLHLAVRHCSETQTVETLVKASANLDASNANGLTPLHLAGRYNRDQAAKILIKAGAKVDAVDLFGQTPLHYSAVQGAIEVANVLIELGAKTDAVDGYDVNFLYMAILGGHQNFINAMSSKYRLPTKFNVAANNPIVGSDLKLAIEKNHISSVKYILDNVTIDNQKIDVNSFKYQGYNLLHYATGCGHAELIQLLIDQYQADINSISDNGLRSIELAVQNSRIEAMDLLVKNYNLNVNSVNIYGNTLLHQAAHTNQISAVKHLIKELGANVNLKANDGNTALHIAARNGHTEVASLLDKVSKISEFVSMLVAQDAVSKNLQEINYKEIIDQIKQDNDVFYNKFFVSTFDQTLFIQITKAMTKGQKQVQNLLALMHKNMTALDLFKSHPEIAENIYSNTKILISIYGDYNRFENSTITPLKFIAAMKIIEQEKQGKIESIEVQSISKDSLDYIADIKSILSQSVVPSTAVDNELNTVEIIGNDAN